MSISHNVLAVLAMALVVALTPMCATGHVLGEQPSFPAERHASGFAEPGWTPTPQSIDLALLPPAPPAALGDDSLASELETLRERLEILESAHTKRTDADLKKKEDEARRPTVKWSGQLQADTYLFSQDEASRAAVGDIDNGTAFRRARFGMLGDYGPAEYRIEFDFALSGRPSFLDVYAGLNDIPGLGRVRVGHFFEPFSLERQTPNRFVTFMERSLADLFAPARNTGIMANNTFDDQRGTWAAGFFRSDSDVFGDDLGDEFEAAVTGRVTYLPYYDDATGRCYVHTGLGLSHRQTNADQVRFRSQPEARIGAANPTVPAFVDTGIIAADSFQLIGLEAAWVNGPLAISSEYMLVPVDSQTAGELFFHGWYIEGSYFLTGEHRPYRREFGTFDRVIPKRDFVSYSHEPNLETGPGAWELALRLSQLDLRDGPIDGGQLTDLTFGVNWYLSPYLRVTSNYIHAFAQHAGGTRSDTDIFAMRVGFDF